MKVIIYSIHGFDQPFLEKAAKDKHELTFTDKSLKKETVHLAKGNQAIAIFSNDDASAPVLEELAKIGIKYIALRSVGFDHVDLLAAEKLGMKVANVPEYSPYAIAEHSVALLLLLNRKLLDAQRLIHLQDFRLDELVGFDLNGKTVGVIGTGKIGMAFAKIMHGFGCKLLACDPIENHEAKSLNLHYVSLEKLLSESDVVSLHCPLNEHTRYLLSEKEFSQMKKGAILINTARGAVVETKSLIQYLKNGHLGGACLDVYEKEKGLFFFDHRHTVIDDPVYAELLSLKNVVITGHQAFLTKEALTGIANTTIENLNYWSLEKTSPNELY